MIGPFIGIGMFAEGSIPSNAILDASGSPILDASGSPILGA